LSQNPNQDLTPNNSNTINSNDSISLKAKQLLKSLTKDQLKQISTAAKIGAARLHYRDYCEYVHNGKWKPFRHLLPVCEKLQDIIDGKTKRLMIFMPPRNGKSMTVTETFPSYFLGKFPDKRVIEVSYGKDLAERFGWFNRQKINEHGQTLFGLNIDRSNSSKTNWAIEDHKGGMISVGVGGSITGHGADLMIIDDPVKNRSEANSEVYRESLWNEWTSTLRTRLHPNASVIVILTRWHEDDLAGRLLAQDDGAEWDVISLPAIAEGDDDLLGREEGEALCPELYPIEELEKIKFEVGSSDFASLYQQRPSPIGGNIFNKNWWQFYDSLPQYFEIMVQSWDCSFKALEDSDYVVGQVWGRIRGDFYLIDQIRGKKGFSDTYRAIVAMTNKHPKAIQKLIEDKANGTAIIETLQRDIPGIKPINPQGGKISRAQAISSIVESGNVFLPSPLKNPWVVDFLDECTGFPKVKHDDQVDSMSQALNYLYTKMIADNKKINQLNDLPVFKSGFSGSNMGY